VVPPWLGQTARFQQKNLPVKATGSWEASLTWRVRSPDGD